MADKTTITLPKGTAVYPALNRPDTKFDELGQYKADVRIPVQEAQAVMEKLGAAYKAYMGKAISKADNTLWKMETDEDGNQTGFVVFKCRVKNKLKKDGSTWDRKPKLFDAKLKPLPAGVNPWGGTEMRVNVEVYEWLAGSKKGVSLQPLGVQIIKLVSGTGGSADPSAMGFEEEEGFSAEDAEGEDAPFDTDDNGDEGEDGNGDF